MRERILDVTSYTTLDYADARIVRADGTAEAPAVVDVSEPDDADETVPPDRVCLSVELDPVELGELPTHATIVDLSPDDAVDLADDLLGAADEATRGDSEQ